MGLLCFKAHRGASRKMPLALWVSRPAVEGLCSGSLEGNGEGIFGGRCEMGTATSSFPLAIIDHSQPQHGERTC